MTFGCLRASLIVLCCNITRMKFIYPTYIIRRKAITNDFIPNLNTPTNLVLLDQSFDYLRYSQNHNSKIIILQGIACIQL